MTFKWQNQNQFSGHGGICHWPLDCQGIRILKGHSQKGGRTPWKLVRQRRTLYGRVPGVKTNGAMPLDLRLARRSWRYLTSSSGLASKTPLYSQDPPPESIVIWWVLMWQRCTLYLREASVKSSNPPVPGPEWDLWLFRNLPSSPESASISSQPSQDPAPQSR